MMHRTRPVTGCSRPCGSTRARRLDAAGETQVSSRSPPRPLPRHVSPLFARTFEAMMSGLVPPSRVALWWERDNVLVAPSTTPQMRDDGPTTRSLAARALMCSSRATLTRPSRMLDRIPRTTPSIEVSGPRSRYLGRSPVRQGRPEVRRGARSGAGVGGGRRPPLIVGIGNAVGAPRGLRSRAGPPRCWSAVGRVPGADASVRRDAARVRWPDVKRGRSKGTSTGARSGTRRPRASPHHPAEHGLVMVVDHVGSIARCSTSATSASDGVSSIGPNNGCRNAADPDRDYSTVLSWPSQVVGIRDGLAAPSWRPLT